MGASRPSIKSRISAGVIFGGMGIKNRDANFCSSSLQHSTIILSHRSQTKSNKNNQKKKDSYFGVVNDRYVKRKVKRTSSLLSRVILSISLFNVAHLINSS